MIRSLLSAIAVLVFAAGCAQTGGHKYTKFHPSDDPAVAAAPRSGEYFVAFRPAKGAKDLAILPYTSRQIDKGDSLGFRMKDGRVLAIADNEEFALDVAPEMLMYCCWYRPTYRASRVNESMSNFADGVGRVLGVAALLGLAVASEALEHDDDHHGGWFHSHRRDRDDDSHGRDRDDHKK